MEAPRPTASCLRDAVGAAVRAAGGGTALANALKLRPSAISNWRHTGIPIRRVRRVSELTGIPMAELRPDLFGPDGPPVEAA